MLLHPGAGYDYDGQRRRYPDVKLVYWCGGNPFHHHQDLARLREAFARPQTVVVHDPFWTATARHADIVLPVDDVGRARRHRRRQRRLHPVRHAAAGRTTRASAR